MNRKTCGIYEKYVKRPLDFLLSLFSIAIFLPIFIGIAFLVRIKLGSPVFFTQERPGKDEIIFKLYKFRTMTDERDKNGVLLPDSLRLTPFGLSLRSSSLDELPELFNIVKGDMALIGPRPLLIQYLPYYTEQERMRHTVRPGLSGLAQVNGRNYVKWDERLAYDVKYVENITFLGDVRLILLTLKKVFCRDDIAPNTEEVESFLDEERRNRADSIIKRRT